MSGDAYESGRRDAFEEAAGMLEMSDATIRLHCGEMTAQEMRSVKAVLRWKAGAMRAAATDERKITWNGGHKL